MTDTINKIIKEFRERFVKSAFTDEQDLYYVQCDAQDLESFLTSTLEKAILEAREQTMGDIVGILDEALSHTFEKEQEKLRGSEVKGSILNYYIFNKIRELSLQEKEKK